jgi:uncharacterized lipoprotein YehR (DUF1307 family)
VGLLKLVLVFVCFLIVAGCGSVSTSQRYNGHLPKFFKTHLVGNSVAVTVQSYDGTVYTTVHDRCNFSRVKRRGGLVVQANSC